MIDRYAAGAGLAAGLIYAMLFFAYEVTQGWDIPLAVAVGLGLVIVVAAALTTELAIRLLVAEASKEV